MLDLKRVKNMLFKPRAEWVAVAAESATPQSLYYNYAMPLAAIQPVCAFIARSPFAASFLGSRYPASSLSDSLVHEAVGYALSLLIVYVYALIIDGMATRFGAQRAPIRALKVSVYASTLTWVAGVLVLLPASAPLGLIVTLPLGLIVSLYSLYLLYMGLRVVMKAPPERVLGYTVTVIVAYIVLSGLAFFLSMLIRQALFTSR